MNDLTYFFGGALAVACVLTSISIWAPRRIAVRSTALAVAAIFVPLSYAGFATLLSKPKPVSLEWIRASTEEANVLGATIREGEAIYVWLQMPDIPEPRAYMLPWSFELAKQLQEARRQAEERGTGLGMRLPFEHSWDNQQPKFYPLPQPALPPKDAPGAPTHFAHPSTET